MDTGGGLEPPPFSNSARADRADVKRRVWKPSLAPLNYQYPYITVENHLVSKA
jgi:hypothetical protein